MIFRFGVFELDDSTFTLLKKGKPQHVEPLVFDLIRYLIERPGEVISRDDLMSAVWNGRIVSDATISGSIKAARKALGDSGAKQLFIKTVRGRGVEFVGQVEFDEPAGRSGHISPTDKPSQRSLPSLIVLPFDVFNTGIKSGMELDGLADGLVENLTTVLTRIPLLNISARLTSFDLKNKPRSAADIRTQIGVDFMLEGSLQLVSEKIRVNVQLIDTEGGFHLWAKQIDRAPDNDVLDSLLNEIVAVLEPQLVRGILDRVTRDEREPGGKQLLIQAMGLLSLKGWHRDTFKEAAALLEKALVLEPDLALARAYLALILGLGHRVGLLEKSAKVVNQAEQEAELALRLNNFDSTTVGLAGCALADIGQPERALLILQSAINLNPNNGHAWAALGSAQTLLGQYKLAIENLRKGIDLSPADNRRAVWCAILGIAYLLGNESVKAADAAHEGILHDERNYLPHVVLASACLSQKNIRGATEAIEGANQAKPDLTKDEIYGIVGAKAGAMLQRLYRNAHAAKSGSVS